MISTISNRQPSQVLYEAVDYEIPVSTGAQGKISVSSFFLFSTASVNRANVDRRLHHSYFR
jgi:hypothetical protein